MKALDGLAVEETLQVVRDIKKYHLNSKVVTELVMDFLRQEGYEVSIDINELTGNLKISVTEQVRVY